jgi:Tfp pilus assembly protein PilZ
VAEAQSQRQRALLVVGAFQDDATSRIREAATDVSVPTATVGQCDKLPSALEAVDPAAILLRMESPGAGDACAHVRAHARFAQVPIFGVTGDRTDIAFPEIFGWGGDDLVSVTSSQPLVRRLRALVPAPMSSVPRPSGMMQAVTAVAALAAGTGSTTPASQTSQGTAVVAGPERAWRTVMGRALYNGGFAVRFAATGGELVSECLAEGLRIVIASDDLIDAAEGGVGPALLDARGRGSNAAWVLVAPPKRMATMAAIAVKAGRAGVLDGFAPPENVLFVANEILSARGVDKRGSARMLYGASVAFRAAGRDEDEIGFSYNISATGVYVRTLAPLEPAAEVWLEMWPPRSERRVRLGGTVAWRRPFGPRGGATVPAGFGVQIKDGLSGDLDRWRAGYEMFAASLLGTPAISS